MKPLQTSAKPIVTRLGKAQTIDGETGEVSSEKDNSMMLMPPAADVCQECAVDHPRDQPHNQQSLYYQYHFYARHNRWPTWSDAMAHCTDDVKTHWRFLLIESMKTYGITIPDDLMDPKPGVR